MTRLLFSIFLLFGLRASAQLPDWSILSLYRAGALDTARHSLAPDRALAYWNVAVAYSEHAKWDSAAKALDKSVRFQPIDSIVQNNPNALVRLSQIEHHRRRTNNAIAYAERALTLSTTASALDSLAGWLQVLHGSVGNEAGVWRYKYLADSLRWTNQSRALVDSLSTLQYGLQNAAQTNEAASKNLQQLKGENAQLMQYLLLLAGGAGLLLIGLVAALLTRKKSVVAKAGTNVTAETGVATRSAVHDLVGLTDLMLQRGRTGDDLVFLKGMERELQRLWQRVNKDFAFPSGDVDEDRVMRQLKGIRNLVFSDNADAAFLLKNWLRKHIKLCDIQTAESFEALPSSFQPHAVVYDCQVESIEATQRLQSIFTNVPVVVSSADGNSTKALRKPHALALLLDRLMAVYKPQLEEPRAEPVIATAVPAQTDIPTAPASNAEAIRLNCNLLEEAYAERNGDKLLAACAGLLPLFEQGNSPATKWLKLLADPPENISEVQIELAYRNVITYCKKV